MFLAVLLPVLACAVVLANLADAARSAEDAAQRDEAGTRALRASGMEHSWPLHADREA